MRKLITLSLVSLLVLVLGGLLWHFAHEFIFYRLTVLEVPIRFEEGLSIDHEFTVDIPATYWVAIQYDEVFRSTIETPMPEDEFTAESEVRLRGRVIAKGGTATLPAETGPWRSNRDQVARYLSSFHAEPGEKYSLSLRITRLFPGSVGKDPQALVEIEPRFTPFYDLRKFVFVCLIAAIGIVVLSVAAGFAIGLRCRKRTHPAQA